MDKTDVLVPIHAVIQTCYISGFKPSFASHIFVVVRWYDLRSVS